ncbi:hypothetical protein [Candidatus Methylacidithermus pantelleriae]|uniref:hypothetical protein n=1 Tax=Candidatus Methylacidithermus pantelleriae TaxID=2744239 RepID=UPI00157D4B8D|nr:hypothetical protein [Candidatus Methylacidithermus pantelleriae]
MVVSTVRVRRRLAAVQGAKVRSAGAINWLPGPSPRKRGTGRSLRFVGETRHAIVGCALRPAPGRSSLVGEWFSMVLGTVVRKPD